MLTLVTIGWWVFFLVLLVVLGTLAYGGISAAPWVPLWRGDVRRMLSIAGTKPGEEVYDLGAGDGRIVVIAASEFGAQATGFELAVLPYFLAQFIILLRGLRGRASMRYANFFNIHLGNADVICTFLTPGAMEKLKPKFEAELKPGSRVVSFAFHVPGWEPTKIDKPNKITTPIYLYER